MIIYPQYLDSDNNVLYAYRFNNEGKPIKASGRALPYENILAESIDIGELVPHWDIKDSKITLRGSKDPRFYRHSPSSIGLSNRESIPYPTVSVLAAKGEDVVIKVCAPDGTRPCGIITRVKVEECGKGGIPTDCGLIIPFSEIHKVYVSEYIYI